MLQVLETYAAFPMACSDTNTMADPIVPDVGRSLNNAAHYGTYTRGYVSKGHQDVNLPHRVSSADLLLATTASTSVSAKRISLKRRLNLAVPQSTAGDDTGGVTPATRPMLAMTRNYTQNF